MPPLTLMRTEGIEVLEEWFRWAEEWSMLLRVYGGLTPVSRVLEIGCGLGRIAFGLRFLLSPGGTYAGFEIVEEKVRFLREAFAPSYPNFEFTHADVANTEYNPGGAAPASSYEFPYEDGRFDIVFAASVFTHMAPEAVRRYFAESARVLAPGGRCVFSFFLLDNYDPRRPRPHGFARPDFDFLHHLPEWGDGFAFAVLENPEQMTAYRLALVERFAAEAGLRVLGDPVPGLWSGAFAHTIGAQDVVVLCRSGEDGQPAETPDGPGAAYAPERLELLERLRSTEQRLARYELGWEPGHFYSPIPSLDRVRQREHAIYGDPPRSLPGIDLNEDVQLELVETIASYYDEQPFADSPEVCRYSFENPNFGRGEAITLCGLLRHLRPRRVIELGSGYSTAAILDVAERFLERKPELTIVDPYPELAESLLRPADEFELLRIPAEEVETARFGRLEQGDLLFVDSTHVAKVDSDVNHLTARILPALRPGVVVHFHDIYYPFEYPRSWVLEGRAWNEAYALRAFLTYNSAFRILFFNSFLATFHQDAVVRRMPLFAADFGSSLWLERV
jgi:SAM-dependent methyltransferase